jgi:hypothetical protein
METSHYGEKSICLPVTSEEEYGYFPTKVPKLS